MTTPRIVLALGIAACLLAGCETAAPARGRASAANDGYGAAVRARSRAVAGHSGDNVEASTPHPELMTYPPDWPGITERRRASDREP